MFFRYLVFLSVFNFYLIRTGFAVVGFFTFNIGSIIDREYDLFDPAEGRLGNLRVEFMLWAVLVFVSEYGWHLYVAEEAFVF